MTGSVICFMKAYAVYFYCVTFLFSLWPVDSPNLWCLFFWIWIAAQTFKRNTGSPSGPVKNEMTSLWPLVRKLQLPVGLVLLIFSGWQNPLGLIVNILHASPELESVFFFHGTSSRGASFQPDPSRGCGRSLHDNYLRHPAREFNGWVHPCHAGWIPRLGGATCKPASDPLYSSQKESP
jgi:hypothetical protein